MFRVRMIRLASLAACLAVACVATACRGELTGTRTTVLPPLPPDTGSMGLTAVAGVPILILVDDSAVTDTAAYRRLLADRATPWNAAVRAARLVDGADTLLTAGRSLAIDVNPTRRLVFVGTRRDVTTSGLVMWAGSLQGGRPGAAAVYFSVDYVNANFAVFGTDGAQYSLRSLGGGFLSISYVDGRKIPLD